MQQQNESRVQDSPTGENTSLPNTSPVLSTSSGAHSKLPKSTLTSSSLPQPQDEALQEHFPQIIHYLSRFLQPLDSPLWVLQESDRREIAEASNSAHHNR